MLTNSVPNKEGTIIIAHILYLRKFKAQGTQLSGNERLNPGSLGPELTLFTTLFYWLVYENCIHSFALIKD